MYVDETGTGPVVLLLHGSAMSPTYFEPLVAKLAPSHRVLVPHFPGYGKSPAVKGTYSLDAVEAELEEALRERGVTEAAVVGTSLGGWRALSLALRAHVRVSRLMLLGGYAGLLPAHADGMRGLAGALRAMADFSDAAFRRQIALMFLAPANATPTALALVEHWLDATTPAALAAEMDALSHSEDLHPRLAGLSLPLVARVGELDGATPPAYSERIVAAVPGATLERVPGCGHALLVEDFEATLAAIMRHLNPPPTA